MPQRDSYAHGEFCWVDYVAHDMGRAIEFYKQLFSWDCEVQDTQGGPPYAMFRTANGGVSLAGIGQMSDEMKAQSIPPMWNSYINVDDIEATAERAEKLGATIIAPVMSAMDAGRLCFLADPTGASVGLWERGRHHGAGLKDEPGAFCWNELATRDFEGAKSFYAELLGWTYADNPHAPTPEYAIVRVGETQVGGIIGMTEEWGEVPPHWSVYLKVGDADAMTARLVELGGKALHGPFDVAGVCRLSVTADPQGGHFHLIQMLA